MIDPYQRLIGDARLAIYDGMVNGTSFGKTIRGIINMAMNFGERQGIRMEMPMSELSSDSIRFKLTDNSGADQADLLAMVTCEALGKMFSGNMNEMVTFVVDSGIWFGFDCQRVRIAYANRDLAEMFDAIVENMKLVETNQIPDEPATAFFEALKQGMNKNPEIVMYYTQRLLREEKLAVNKTNKAFQDIVQQLSHIFV